MSELLISGEIELSAGIPRITPNDRRNSKQPLRRVTFSVESTTGRMAFDFRYKSPGRRTRETMVGRQVAAATESAINRTSSRVPRMSCRARYRNQKKNKVTGAIQN